MEVYKIKKVSRIPESCTPCDLHFAIIHLASRTPKQGLGHRVLGFLIVDTCISIGLSMSPCIFLNG